MGFALYQTGVLPGLPDKLIFSQDGMTVGELLQEIAAIYGAGALAEVLDGSGGLAGDTMVILNGRIIRPPQVLAEPIPPASELVISTLIAGG